jgi:flagellar hook-associated protein 1 FlgK
VENLTTDSGYSKYESFKQQLDQFANAFADITNSYIKNADGSFSYGRKFTDQDNSGNKIDEIRLFEGSDVMSMTFNATAVDTITQQDLDYLATMQWKDDVDFNGLKQTGTSGDAESLSKFYQELLVDVSSSKETNDWLKETQDAVKEALQKDYDALVKVDKDEEMLNLIKFQASYEANAKMVTVVDEMLQTILGLKR